MRFRRAIATDVDALVDVQQDGAVLGLGHIFPQESHPFPRDAVVRRWLTEVADPATDVYVSTDDRDVLSGFAAIRVGELLHFGTSPATWGTGLASELHDAVLAVLIETWDVSLVRLRVFEANLRARRFYEKHGWRPTGGRSRSSFSPHPELLEYNLPVNAPKRRRS